ncbi:MAG: NAD(P)/FAD-dependent oxidoreductase [Candidatus Margulisbacteria bacterium]|nr:NAD(P)/FAD-dependent oxidoreductase [Candidatus Margulisiibacteriota bacterium]
MDKISIAVIGAGVIGLAIAESLSRKHEIVVLEKEHSFGQETSSRNSEVIHAGIYYPTDTLKARLCVEGNRLIYPFCLQNNIPHNRLGKIIVAQNQTEISSLEKLEKQAKANGVDQLEWFDQEQIRSFEPAVNGVVALFSPDTGIIDSHSLMKCLEQKAKENGAIISYGSKVTGIRKSVRGYTILVNDEELLEAEVVINAAGLYSDKVAGMVGIDLLGNQYNLHYCKGDYFAYSKPSFIEHLVYPVPEQDLRGLGVHSVIDLQGCLKFGPDANYVDAIDYKIDPAKRLAFYNSIKDLFSGIEENDLSPDQSGIRPKLQGPGEGFRDFAIKEESDKGYPGFINLIGIESPGLTSCLAIAQQVAKMLL